MPIPEQPLTRGEQYLNAIATGDASGIPEQPYTRKEMYLDAIARNGGGGGSSSGGVLVVNIIEGDEDSTLDKTWQEIHDALASMPVICILPSSLDANVIDQYYVYSVGKTLGSGQYKVDISSIDDEIGNITAVAATANDYPVIQWE